MQRFIQWDTCNAVRVLSPFVFSSLSYILPASDLFVRELEKKIETLDHVSQAYTRTHSAQEHHVAPVRYEFWCNGVWRTVDCGLFELRTI
jgi:hypothetical protein